MSVVKPFAARVCKSTFGLVSARRNLSGTADQIWALRGNLSGCPQQEVKNLLLPTPLSFTGTLWQFLRFQVYLIVAEALDAVSVGVTDLCFIKKVKTRKNSGLGPARDAHSLG